MIENKLLSHGAQSEKRKQSFLSCYLWEEMQSQVFFSSFMARKTFTSFFLTIYDEKDNHKLLSYPLELDIKTYL